VVAKTGMPLFVIFKLAAVNTSPLAYTGTEVVALAPMGLLYPKTG
jgi:hypothetical protein